MPRAGAGQLTSGNAQLHRQFNKVLNRMSPDVLVWYRCVTCYCNISSLKQFAFSTSRFPWVRSLGAALLGCRLRVSPCHSCDARATAAASEGLTGEGSVTLPRSFGLLAEAGPMFYRLPAAPSPFSTCPVTPLSLQRAFLLGVLVGVPLLAAVARLSQTHER